MFELTLPWWEFIARGAVIFICLLVMVRVAGKRAIGQMTPFDLLVVVLVSEAVSNGLVGEDHSVLGGLLTAATLIALNAVSGIAASRSERAHRLLEGEAVLVGRNGKFFEKTLQSHRVALRDMEQALREADCPLHEMECAFLEANGSISVLKKNPKPSSP